MTHVRSLLVVAVAVILLGVSAPTASALEVRGKGQSPSSLTQADVRRNVRILLTDYIGPAVTSNLSKPVVSVWKCRTGPGGGRCNGAVKAGAVRCRGVFRVRISGKVTAVFPIRAVCSS